MATCHKGHKRTEQENQQLASVQSHKPGIDYLPRWEDLRLRRSINTGEYKSGDAKDTPALFSRELRTADPELLQRESDKQWDAWVDRNRRDWGLSHLTADNSFNKNRGESPAPHHPTDARAAVLVRVGVQDIQIKAVTRGGVFPQVGGGKRKSVKDWSRKSRSRCELHIRNVRKDSIKTFLTLTYPESFPVDGKAVKKHLHVMKQWLRRRGVSGIWFLEFQKRGAPHFHAFLDKWLSPRRVAMQWYKTVGSNDPKHLAWHRGLLGNRPCIEAMRKPHAASYYASKYACKCEQKSVPADYKHVGRFWGAWGHMRVAAWLDLWWRGGNMFDSAVNIIREFRRQRGLGDIMLDPERYSSTLRGSMEEGFEYWLEPLFC